jgi:hypothetical protein
MITASHALCKPTENNSWWYWLPDVVMYQCPNGHIGSLDDHEIADDGTVSPSVVCPHVGCGFHDNIKLADWNMDINSHMVLSG